SGDIHDVKASHGYKQVIIETDKSMPDIADIEGVIVFETNKRHIKVTIQDESFAEKIYHPVISHGYVRSFQVLEPSLKDIFIDKVGDLHE
ncbi:ABC transporter, partial [Klebsiella pneumoniae]